MSMWRYMYLCGHCLCTIMRWQSDTFDNFRFVNERQELFEFNVKDKMFVRLGKPKKTVCQKGMKEVDCFYGEFADETKGYLCHEHFCLKLGFYNRKEAKCYETKSARKEHWNSTWGRDRGLLEVIPECYEGFPWKMKRPGITLARASVAKVIVCNWCLASAYGAWVEFARKEGEPKTLKCYCCFWCLGGLLRTRAERRAARRGPEIEKAILDDMMM